MAEEQTTQVAQQGDSAGERMRKHLEAWIESMVTQDPSIKGRATVAAMYGMLQVPDASFGWKPKDGAMGLPEKLVCIATSLRLGLDVGTGQVIWMGNQPYVKKSGARWLSLEDPNWVPQGKPVWRKFNDEEMAIFDVGLGDRTVALEMTVRIKGEVCEFVGHGMIGADELQKTDRNGNPLPGFQNKKAIGMTLKTRAEGDLLNRNYPLRGLPIYDESEAIEVEAKGLPAGPTAAELREGTAAEKALQADILRGKACAVFIRELNACMGRGISGAAIEAILGRNVDNLKDEGTVEQLEAATDVLRDLKAPMPAPAPERESLPPKRPRAKREVPIPATGVQVTAVEGTTAEELPGLGEEEGEKAPGVLTTLPDPLPPPTPPSHQELSKPYRVIQRILAEQPSKMIVQRVQVLEQLKLQTGDDVHLATAYSRALKSRPDRLDLSGFDELITARGGNPFPPD